jgi:hypothetical protein
MKQSISAEHHESNAEQVSSSAGGSILHPMQRKIDASPRQRAQQARIAQLRSNVGPERSNGLPSRLRAGVEALSGMDMGHVQVHRNSAKPAQMNALAYAQGSQIHLGPGQEKHLPHEAWHVVQQAQGRVPVTRQLRVGAPINDDPALEREADTMGARAMSAGAHSAAAAAVHPAPLTQSPESSPRQGKWFRMSSILDREDEDAVAAIREQAEKGDYLGAFALLIRETRQLVADADKLIRMARALDALGMVLETLRKTYSPEDQKAYTAAELIETMEGELVPLMSKHPELAESVAAQEDSPQEIGLAAGEEIRELIRSKTVKDEGELEGRFEAWKLKYGMQTISIDRTKSTHVLKYRINPSFEIQLSGGLSVEMRSEGTGSGANKTRVQWTPSTLNLSTTSNPGGGSYTVGNNMRANPLSQDHVAGSRASADTDHVGMMKKLPASGNRAMTGSGSGPYYFIRGHLLNDNLGGIANEVNLFPITHEANGQHKSFVEEYIKHGISQGYVYRYEVQIENITVGDEPKYGGYYVDSDISFDFARLDSSQNDVAGTSHKGKIESRYKATGADPFDKSVEYATDYGGSYNSPVTVGSEDIYTPGERSPRTKNTGLTGNVTTFGVGLPLGSTSFGGSAQAIDSSASLVPKGQSLSLCKSTRSNVVAYFGAIVNGWNATSIDNWLLDVRTNSYTRWDAVFDSATTSFGLDASLVANLRKNYLTRVSINGKAVGT